MALATTANIRLIQIRCYCINGVLILPRIRGVVKGGGGNYVIHVDDVIRFHNNRHQKSARQQQGFLVICITQISRFCTYDVVA